MDCAICGGPMEEEYHAEFNGMMCEQILVCAGECRYEEQFAYGAHRVFIEGVEYLCGDPSTIDGSLMAWRLWHAIVIAREAKNDGGISDE